MYQETYVVRIYRRAQRNAGDVLGIVEIPGSQRQAAFNDLAELAAILAHPRRYLRHPPQIQP
jgi:hypothetical protein